MERGGPNGIANGISRQGAVFSQVVEGEEVRETKYSITEDCLAMKWAVLTHWYYLLWWSSVSPLIGPCSATVALLHGC